MKVYSFLDVLSHDPAVTSSIFRNKDFIPLRCYPILNSERPHQIQTGYDTSSDLADALQGGYCSRRTLKVGMQTKFWPWQGVSQSDLEFRLAERSTPSSCTTEPDIRGEQSRHPAACRKGAPIMGVRTLVYSASVISSGPIGILDRGSPLNQHRNRNTIPTPGTAEGILFGYYSHPNYAQSEGTHITSCQWTHQVSQCSRSYTSSFPPPVRSNSRPDEMISWHGLFAEDQQPTHQFCNAFPGLHAQTLCHPAQSAHDGLYTMHCDGVAQLFKKGVTNICGTYHTCLPTHLRSQACHHPQRPITSSGEIGVFVYSAGFKAVLDKLGRRGGRLSTVDLRTFYMWSFAMRAPSLASPTGLQWGRWITCRGSTKMDR
ncbi:hypothetical protein BJ322DRAFT_527488 [Thelephora terrestris]|uniref:Uncharacterized protein n=1 Tax=Thelephora terrestris TaxID=56493 RepID=A0A9P6HKN3_9AGAM|nr:hypothetical protein BJ322DRAFT_527488 [Thelephora terrestris]